jgi:plasmid maintenance system antidote protein VapI
VVVQTEINDDMILDCYRLASFYHVSPEVFLNMEISEVNLHRRRTAELERLRREAQEDAS